VDTAARWFRLFDEDAPDPAAAEHAATEGGPA
jgi:hypothetical protein